MLHYDCSHVHPIFCADLIIYFLLLNLDIITSTPPLGCLRFVLGVLSIAKQIVLLYI